MPLPRPVVAGAGMAGLVAAARLRELRCDPVVRERGTRVGGSMVLSSGFVWRHREWADFRRECPAGDARLQRLVWERLDDALDWLESLGAEALLRHTGNPLTAGRRFDPRRLVEVLLRHAGTVELAGDGCAAVVDGRTPAVLCTGGFAASPELVARHIAPAAPLRLRGNPWSHGDGLRAALARGGMLGGGMDEFYGRNMPDAAWGEDELVSAAQLYARFATVVDETGAEVLARGRVTWSETNVVQATARRPGARAYYLLDERALAQRVRERTVGEIVAAAPAEAHVAPADLPFTPPHGIVAAVRVVASITHTIGGIRVDEHARVLREAGGVVAGLFAAGVDVGGVATGGYASGLAQALVFGLVAAESLAACL